MQGIPFRTLETFSSDDLVSRYITDANTRRAYLENVYRYLVQRKYFKLVRQLIEEKVPPLYDVVLSPPNSISETLLQMIQHPLRLMSTVTKNSSNVAENPLDTRCQQPASLISAECATLILSSFVEEILVPEYTKPIRLFVIPCLANSVEFPFLHLLQYLSDSIVHEYACESSSASAQQTIEYTISGDNLHSHLAARNHLMTGDKIFRSSYLFHSFLTLGQLNLDRINDNAIWIRNYINVLGKLSENIRKLQQRTQHSLFRQYDMEIEAEDETDSDEEGERRIETISSIERDCLFEAITLLNEQQRVDLILKNIDNHLDDDQLLYSLCKTCHNLMLYHRTAVFEFRYFTHKHAICGNFGHFFQHFFA